MEYYNGYSPQERMRKLRALHKLFPNHSHPYYKGLCHLCGNPNSPVAPHSEDYSEPYLWEMPAVYALCRTCHDRVHKRFKNPWAWAAYKLHIRRGGYGSDLKSPDIKPELADWAKKLEYSQVHETWVTIDFQRLRPGTAPSDQVWWEELSVDSNTLTSPWARKRSDHPSAPQPDKSYNFMQEVPIELFEWDPSAPKKRKR